MTGLYTVIWSHLAVETNLAQHVLLAMERGYPVAQINRAMHEIDRLLNRNPKEEGESRSGFQRVLIVNPLSVMYEVYEDERIVYISEVHYSPRPA